jgi:heme exporter protein B
METGAIRQLINLFLNELKLEWRNRYAINGILLQLVASIFICYLIFATLTSPVWNALYWLIFLFVTIHAVGKSFGNLSEGRLLYYHTIAAPEVIVLAKALVNGMLSASIGLVNLAGMWILLGKPEVSILYFLGIMLLYGLGLGILFTMLSALAAKTKGGQVLMPVLGFPLIIPLILISVRASSGLFMNVLDNVWTNMLLLLAFDAMVLILSAILFKFVWRD